MSKARFSRALVLGLAGWVVSIFLALRLGVVPDASPEVVHLLRLPRAVLASAVGMGLSVSGAVLQALFSNPLCEPYTLGISSGAALGAVLGAALGLHWVFAGLTASAFLGALSFTFILFLISRRNASSNLTLLMAGVMLGFLGSSLVALWMALSDPNGIQSAMFWILGDLSRARPQGAWFCLAAIVLLITFLWAHSRQLDGFLMGEEDALSLGVAVPRLRTRILVLVSLVIALSVSMAGMIGFIGLVVPHFARRAVGSLHYRLLPICAIWGAAFLTLADAMSRFAFRPYELPVGVITSLIGAPLFLFIMLRKPGENPS